MFSWITNPIHHLRVLRRIRKELTPKQVARFDSATTDEEKDEIALQIVREIYPGAFA